VDFATLIGLVGAMMLIASAVILGVSPDVFLNAPALLIVIGGSLLVVLAKFSFQQFLGAFKAAARAFKFKLPEARAVIDELVNIAGVARRKAYWAWKNAR
jgi:chemotaxis protein MotA